MRLGITLFALVVVIAGLAWWGLEASRPSATGGSAVRLAPDEPLQQRLDEAQPGTVFELQAGQSYQGPLIVRTPGLTLRAGGPGAVVTAGAKDDVIAVQADGITIQGLTVRGGARGIAVENASQVRLSGNRILASDVAIEVNNAQEVSVQDNTVDGSRFMGISLSREVTQSRVTGNTLQNFQGVGVRVSSSTQNVVQRNALNNGPQSEISIEVSLGGENSVLDNVLVGAGAGQVGILLQGTRQNLVAQNRLQDVQLGIQEELSHDNQVRANHIQGGLLAMRLNQSAGAQVEANTIQDARSGIYLLSSKQVSLTDNQVQGAKQFGLQIEFVSEGQVKGNTISSSSVGIMAAFTDHTTFIANQLHANGWGLALLRSTNNVLRDNVATGQQHVGLSLLLSSSENELSRNRISGNARGIRLIQAPNNALFQNEISDNAVGLTLSHSGAGTRVTQNTLRHNEVGLQVDILAHMDQWDTVLSQFQTPLSIPPGGDNQGYHIEQNNLLDNSDFGVQNLDEQLLLQAGHNWWGTPSGPRDPGQGNAISDHVQAAPWLDQEVRWN